MARRAVFFVLACSQLATAAPVTDPAQPYAGQESRDIKALSPEETRAYLDGKGMGLAKAAELNGYPGPVHVLELAARLELTPAQLESTRAIFASMQSEARRLGHALVEEERKLDHLFASQAITPTALSKSLGEIAALQGKLRTVHLEAHLEQARILTAAQRVRYAELRGYDQGSTGADHHGAHQH